MLKSINPKIIKVYDVLIKSPKDTKIKIREHKVLGSPDIIYYNGTVKAFFDCDGISLKIVEKLSMLQIDKIYVKHKKLVIEVLSPKLN